MADSRTSLNISNNIHVKRAERKLTQQGLADAVNVTRATIHAIEKGNYNPSLELALKLARYFDTDIHSIFFVEDENEK